MKNTKHYMERNSVNRVIAVILCMIMLMGTGCSKQEELPPTYTFVPVNTEEAEIKNGGSITTYIPTNADYSDPLKVNTEELLSFFSLIYESLIRIDETNMISPGLAENWFADDSGYSWTFNLRKGVKWHDGSDFTSEDVKYTYDRIVTLGNGSYYNYCMKNIESIEVKDTYTVEIKMKNTGYNMLYSLNFPIVKANSENSDKPIGTGAYEFSSVGEDDGKVITINTNESWWRQKPIIDEIRFVERDNNETALSSFAAGQLDFLTTSLVSSGQYREEGRTVVADVSTQLAETMLINHNSSMLRNIDMRKALAYAIDRGTIITNVYMNKANVSDVPIPSDSWTYDANSKIYDYNVIKAKEILENLGYKDIDGDGFLENESGNTVSFTLLVSETLENDTRFEAAQLIKDELSKIGIKIEIVLAQYKLGDNNSEYTSKLNNGEFDLALVGFNMNRDMDFREFFSESGNRNFGRFSSAELNERIENINSAKTESGLREAASAFEMQFIEELPFIMLYFRTDSIVYSSNIGGISMTRKPDIYYNIEKWYINE